MPLPSTSRIPRHSAGWGVMRMISDRGGKNINEPPSKWGRHRALTVDDAIRSIVHRAAGIVQAQRLIRHP